MKWFLVALVGGTVFATGCAGAHVEITARQSRYPISMSPVVRDSAGRLYDRHSLEVVGALHTDRTRLGFVYSAFTPLSTFDISDAVNTQVAAVAGEAVVDLRVSTSDGCDVLNNFFLFNFLPIWPGCVPATVTGDIVRRRTPNDASSRMR